MRKFVGLTGGVGAGKSAVATRLAFHGAVIIDADRLAREVVAFGTEGLAEIAATFGPQMIGPDGALDRPALGRVVFGDEAARRKLEAIIHPRVRQRTGEIADAAPADAIVVNDVPLLVEAGLAKGYDMVIVVETSREIRIARLADRGMAPEDARARIAAQATDEQRRAAADVVIDNNGSIEDLNRQVDHLWATALALGSDRRD